MRYVFLDFETFYDKDYSLKKQTYEVYLRDPRFKVHCVAIKINDGPVICYFDHIKEALEEAFSEPSVCIAHNALFDGAILEWIYNVRAVRYYCTQAMSRALWNQRSSSLDELAKSCFPNDKTKRKGKELELFKGVRDVKDDLRMSAYCRNDVLLTFDCFKQMYKWFPEAEFDILNLTLMMFIRPALMLDRARVEAHLLATTERKRELVLASGLAKSTLVSNDKFAQWIIDQGIPFKKIPSPTPKKPSNEKWPLAKNAPEFIDLRADYLHLSHVWDAREAVKSTQEESRSKRLIEHAAHDGRIAMPLNYAAAHTLRWGGTNKVNPQNFSRGGELRKSLLAPPGYMILVHDLAGIEHRLSAWLAKEEWMLDAFKQKRDLYCEFSSSVYGRTITRADTAERYVGKVAELQLQFGAGWKSFRRSMAVGALGGPRLSFSPSEAQRVVELYRTGHAKTKAHWRKLDALLRYMCEKNCQIDYCGLVFEHHRILLPCGLHLNYPELSFAENDGRLEFSYWNGDHMTNIWGGKLHENLCQALARIVIRDDMLQEEAYLSTIGGRVVLTVHDEGVALVPEDKVEEADTVISAIYRKLPKWCDDGSLVLDVESGWASNYSK